MRPEPITGPLIPLQPDGQQYLTFEELLAIPDRVEVDVKIPFWRNARVRVRALGLEEQEAILRKARVVAAQHAKASGDPAGYGSTAQDWQTYILESLREGVIMPALDDAKVYLLKKRNPRAMEMLVELIWSLSAFSQDNINALVEDLTPAPGAADGAPSGAA